MEAQLLEEKKKKLVEDLGVHLEKENLAPIAARIMATLILSGKKGVTFDELVCELHAGKSSISTHLDNLQQSSRVRYFTKPGDRKRYFIINPDLLMNVVNEMISKWENEKQIHTEIKEYKQHCNSLNTKGDGEHFDLGFQEDFLTFLEEITAAVKKFKEKTLKRNIKP